ncbi:helix-turn-helix domain-containing protein [Sphingomonas panacisoli]|uniref:Helix-turn-helix domain-containing protein n=1 Tax=Sphingomonas panacisoli TaxID=1813879 RepID=A0A5B8LGQ6_9SPHN|nr:helix-turn-helix domain-containing protein [Sphingomonas panacisoli]QDZ07478.1 helix-turn-helix domain-containing protein [Sphingomonas panacisoli]
MQDVRTIRRELGVTQNELAGLLGLNQSTISRLEGGALAVDERTVLALEALRARKAAEREPPTETQAHAA